MTVDEDIDWHEGDYSPIGFEGDIRDVAKVKKIVAGVRDVFPDLDPDTIEALYDTRPKSNVDDFISYIFEIGPENIPQMKLKKKPKKSQPTQVDYSFSMINVEENLESKSESELELRITQLQKQNTELNLLISFMKQNQGIWKEKGTKIQEDVVHLKNFLTEDQQIILWDVIKSNTNYMYGSFDPENNTAQTVIFYYQVNTQNIQIPEIYKQFANMATAAAHETCPTIPPTYKPDYLAALAYGMKSKLMGHHDSIGSWVVLFSLGCTAQFFVKGKDMSKQKYIYFESGDALVFNGGPSHQVWHGIDMILPDTCPTYLPGLNNMRVSLQFREYQ
jgi:hypothetical protein